MPETRPLMILIAGPYRSGTNDDPKKIAANVEIFHPIAERLLTHCDAVLRIGGHSEGADRMVAVAREKGLRVFTNIDDIPSLHFQEGT